MSDAPFPPKTPGDAPKPLAPEAPRPRRPWTFLGRIAQALREQNWAAVAVELVIVVLGVVIGFQVTTWGNERVDRARERLVLEDLRRDFALNRDEVRRVREYLRRNRSEFYPRFMSIPLDEVPRIPVDTLYKLAIRTGNYASFEPISGSVDALVASGDLGLIRDPTLRSHLVSFLEAADDSKSDRAAVEHFFVRGLERYASLGGPHGPASDPVVPFSAEAFVRLRQDDEWMSRARLLRGMGYVYAGELATVEAAIDSVLVHLDANLDR